MGTAAHPRSVRVAPGELDSSIVTTRLLVPTAAQPSWSPFQRVAESIANRARQLPTHAHERVEVLTYVTEGFATYQLEAGTPESMQRGGGRLLTTPGRVTHRISPAHGGAVRWFNLVLSLPMPTAGAPRLQQIGPDAPTVEEGPVRIRPIVGPQAPMSSSAGFECQEIQFRSEGTTFSRIGTDRRSLFYATSGRGSVAQQPVEAGEVAFIEGMPGISIQGDGGFSGILAIAPS